jgi:hypothetical protein
VHDDRRHVDLRDVVAEVAERFMAKRAHAHTVEIDASHASFLSHPDAVDKLIVQAAKSVH